MAARSSKPEDINYYEKKRLDRIAENQAKLGERPATALTALLYVCT